MPIRAPINASILPELSRPPGSVMRAQASHDHRIQRTPISMLRSSLHLLPQLSWLEREAVHLKLGSSSLPGSVMPSDHTAFCGMREGNDT